MIDKLIDAVIIGLSLLIVYIFSCAIYDNVTENEHLKIYTVGNVIKYTLEDGERFSKSKPYEVVDTEKGKVIKIYVEVE